MMPLTFKKKDGLILSIAVWGFAMKITYHVKYGQSKKKIVKNPMNFLPWKGPDRDAVAQNADVACYKDEKAFKDPFKVIYSWCLTILWVMGPPGPLSMVPIIRHFEPGKK